MKFAAIGPIAVHLPEKVEDNDTLGAQFPKWDMPLIYAKTGVRQRHIAAPGECAERQIQVELTEPVSRRHDRYASPAERPGSILQGGPGRTA